ncbi:ribosome modulation factor [Thalassolituus oleivorans]|uniref:ribosome modulation factor n=1 Tax=Thalassolituus oleivorans TaxID=187493 RepID=UPI001CE2FF7B|nr:efflux RND transporter permease subunit [Thalassolituus oleivorans]MCA6128517.1 hypothetical protein [Thalassolituus oleivorans 4BN06-13]
MKSSISWFANNPVAANLCMICILVLGFLSIPETRKELLPNVSLERISIQSKLPGASVETVESSICRPIENRIYDIQGTIDLTSYAYEGICSITLDVDEGFVTKEIVDEVKSRLEAKDLLPKEATTPDVVELTVRNRVAKLILSGPVSYSVLTASARQLRTDLLEFSAVSIVELEDMKKSEIRISIPAFNLQKYQISFDEISAMIQKQSGFLPGGMLQTSEGDVLITSDAYRDSSESYANIVIAADPDGGEVRLGDIADIIDNRFSNQPQASFDRQPAVSIDVFRVGNQNITDISDVIHNHLADSNLPQNVKVYVWQDESKNFQSRVDLLVSNAFSGLVLLFIVLLLFLSARLSFWVSLGIPIAFLGTIFILPVFDVSINIVSLFAFILVLGIVVDDAVVVGESIHLQNQKGLYGTEGALQGVFEVYKPIFFAVATTVVAFLPLVSLPGPEGKLMRAIPIVVIGTLIFSLIESLYILPAHLSGTHKNEKPGNKVLTAIQNVFSVFLDTLIKWVYTPVLTVCLRNKGLVVLTFTVVFALFMVLLSQGWIKTALFAAIEGDVVVANVAFPEGSPREKTEKALRHLIAAADQVQAEYEAKDASAIEHIYSVVAPKNTFTSYSVDKSMDHKGQVIIELPSSETRTYSGQDVLARWRELAGDIQDTTSLQYSASLNPTNPDIQIEFSGYDIDDLMSAANQLAEKLRDYDGTFDIHTSQEEEKQEAEIKLKDNAVALGLTLESVIRQINRAFQGNVVQRIQTQDDEVEVWVGLPKNERSSPWYLENMHIEYAPGQYVSLSTIAAIEYRPSKTHIKRYDRKRVISVSAFVNPAQNSVKNIQTDLATNYLDGLVKNMPGIKWDVGGYQRAVTLFLDILMKYYLFAILAMYLMMAVLFSSYSQPLLVLYAIPFGLLGSVTGHILLDLDLTLWSFVGMVAVSGVVVNDNLVLIDYINTQRAKGENVFVSVCEAGRVRFRPIMLTSLTTFVGLAPLISETSVQAQFLIPMAVSLAFGVVFATLISLLLVPATYLMMVEWQTTLLRLFKQTPKGSSEDPVEAAYQRGFEQGTRNARKAVCPYKDDVLSSSWEAGLNDARNL